MSSRPELRLDWCTHEAAKYAVENWHYSNSLPTPPIVRIGVWEANEFKGCVLFSRGANNNLGTPYGLKCTEVCELTRVALRDHVTPVSRILAISIKMMLKQNENLRLVVSYADTNEGHHGGIYQANGWIYCGKTPSSFKYRDTTGRIWHQRQVSVTGLKPQYGQLRRVAKISECKKIPQEGKHRYLMPLDDEMRKQIEPLRKPYPKRVRSEVSGTIGNQPIGGGATPTRTLYATCKQVIKQVENGAIS